MIQSALPNAGDMSHVEKRGLHVAIIMDGNGRWAQARGRRREWGHKAGAKTVRRVVEVSPDLGIGVLTLYAFSSDNWKRPQAEVRLLMRIHNVTPFLTEELALVGKRWPTALIELMPGSVNQSREWS